MSSANCELYMKCFSSIFLSRRRCDDVNIETVLRSNANTIEIDRLLWWWCFVRCLWLLLIALLIMFDLFDSSRTNARIMSKLSHKRWKRSFGTRNKSTIYEKMSQKSRRKFSTQYVARCPTLLRMYYAFLWCPIKIFFLLASVPCFRWSQFSAQQPHSLFSMWLLLDKLHVSHWMNEQIKFVYVRVPAHTNEILSNSLDFIHFDACFVSYRLKIQW